MSAARLRTPLAARAVFIAEESSELIERLRRFAAGDAAAAQALGEALETVDRAHGGLAFVFPGQGPQWTGMGRELMAREPVFRDAIDACETAMVPYVDWSLREQLEADAGSPRSRMDDIAVIQPVLVAVEIALAALWRSWGVEPSAVVGHSMGEVGAAYVAGALTLDDAMRVICKRSALMRRTSGNGAMALIDLSPDDVERRLTPWAGRLSIAVHNAPHSTVVSGDPAALDALLATVEAEGTFNRRVKVDVASHSWQMEPLVPQLVAALDGITPRATSIDMYSTVTGSRISGAELGAVYWGRNLRERVQFKSAVEAAIAAGVETMVELSPHPALVSAIQQTATATGSAVTASGSLRRAEPEQAAMLAAAGGLWVSGYAIDWAKVMPGAFARTALPTYPWQRQRYWHPAAERVSGDARGRGSLAIKRPDDASLDALYTVRWEAAPVPTTGANATTVIIVDTRLEGDAAFTSALTSAFDARGTTVRRVEPDALANALSDSPTDTSLRETVVVCVAPRSERAAYVPVEIAQRALESSNGTAPRMWFMTRGAQAVSGAERVDPWQAALWGAARVVGEEHPELWGGLVDTGSDDDAELAVAAILAQDGEDQVAIRSGERFAARLVSYKPSGVSASLPWRDDGAYLITGGLGEIGLRIAASMVGAGARRIVLLGRTALPPRHEWGESTLVPDSLAGRRVAAIKSLEAKGASVHLLTADVGDEVELSKAIASYRAESWPAIRGVLHAAGALENRLIEDMDRATFDRVVGPKLRGALYLDRLFPDADVFVTFSSTGGFLAQPGQANYAAANAGLDAVVQDRRARGANALSIAWGVWAETGLVRDVAGARNVDEMRRQGVEPFSADEGVALFSWLLQRAEPVVTVLPMNWGKYRRARAGRESSIFRRQLEGITASDGEHGNDDVASQVARAASARERRELIDGVVRDAAARVLRIPANRIEPRRAFGSMGLDSLMALELRNRLVELFARQLPATLLWNYPTLDALGAHLAGLWDDAPDKRPAASSQILNEQTGTGDGTDSLGVSLGDLLEMSDDDAARMLRGTR